jgi:uncharacterized membrane protein YphA (DoxX/SURF4 family)
VASRRPLVAKSSGKGRVAGPPRGIPFWLVRSLLGPVLVAAGALKLFELAFEAIDQSAPTLLLIIFAEAEFVGGSWILAGFGRERMRRWAAAAFVGLAISSLFQALVGKCFYGCFGSLSINPWIVLAFDLAAVAALLGSRPLTYLTDNPTTRAPRLLGLGAISVFIGVLGWHQADLVTVAGTVTVDGRPLHEAILIFTGDSGRIILRTDQDGKFRLPLVRPGLYAVSAPARVSATLPMRDQPGPRPKLKTARRSRLDTTRPYHSGGVEPIFWLEISKCPEHDKQIKF